MVDNNMTAIDLSKQQALDADPKAIQQINFTGKVDQTGTTTLFFIIEEAKKKQFKFFLRNRESIMKLFRFNFTLI